MQGTRYAWLSRYGVALGGVLLILLFKLLFDPVVGRETPFLLFTLAILVSALYGGIGPGFLTTLLSALCIGVAFLPPIGRLPAMTWDVLFQLTIFILEGLAITLLTATRSQALQAHQASDERFRLLVESVKDYAIFMLDPTGHIVSWNAGAERIKGYRAEEVMGAHFSKFYPIEARSHDKPNRELEMAAIEGRIEREGWRMRQDGTRFWANVVITALRDQEGTLRGFAKVTRDVTERRQAEERLHRYAKRLTTLHEIDQAILTAQSMEELVRAALHSLQTVIPFQHGFVVLFNRDQNQAQVISNIPSQDEGLTDEGLTGADLLPLADWAPQGKFQTLSLESDLQLLAAPDPLATHLLQAGFRSLILVPLETEQHLTGVLVLTAKEVDCFISEHQEIAVEVARPLAVALQQAHMREERQRYASELEQRVEARTAELQRANAELEAFAYTVSHDLRAPLRAIQGFSQALLEDYGTELDPVGQEYAQRAVNAAQRMDVMIQDLLAYSRLGRADLPLQTVDMQRAVAEVLLQLEAEIQAHQAHITVIEPLPPVQGHWATLVQVLSNLITNAIKFVPPGIQPQVRIWAEPQAAWVRLSISDNGIGIAPEHQGRIFRVFERLHGMEHYPGTGIGLAIVQRGVERLGGRVGMESTIGQGSLFWFELPLAK